MSAAPPAPCAHSGIGLHSRPRGPHRCSLRIRSASLLPDGSLGVMLPPEGEGNGPAELEKEPGGAGACPATSRAWRRHGFPSPSSLPVSCGSYFMIWSGTGLFLNLGCSSKTGWTVKHWMSGIPESRVHNTSVGRWDHSKHSRSRLRLSKSALLGSSFY